MELNIDAVLMFHWSVKWNLLNIKDTEWYSELSARVLLQFQKMASLAKEMYESERREIYAVKNPLPLFH